MKFGLFIGAVTCLHLVSSQSQCTRESLSNDVVGSLVASSLVAGTQSVPPTIIVTGFTVVCLAADSIITRYRSASLVVVYDCIGGPACPTQGSKLFIAY